MSQQQIERPRIFSHITRSRWLHIEDSLDIGKLRFFIGQYQRGSGAQATAYHFLDADDARPLCLDMSWGRQVDIKDYKGSSNGADGPVSRVLKIKGPKAGKYWVQVDNGPGQIIGAGAVKPAGEPTASISIALTIWEARKLALAVVEYMVAWRVVALTAVEGGRRRSGDPRSPNRTPIALDNPPPRPKVEGKSAPPPANPRISANPRLDAEALFGTKEPTATEDPNAASPQKAQEEPAEVDPPTFFRLANKAIAAGFDLANLQEIIKSQVPWREKHVTLQAAMSA